MPLASTARQGLEGRPALYAADYAQADCAWGSCRSRFECAILAALLEVALNTSGAFMEIIASLPGWAIGALFGAIAGALFGLIGFALTKRGLAWGRFLPVVAIAATVAATNGGLGAWIKQSAITPAYAAEQLVAVNPRLYGFLRDTFPEDFNILTARVAELVKSDASASQLGPMAAEAMATIRRKYAPLIASAPDEDHAEIIRTSAEFYEAMLAHDPAICNEVAMSGPAALINKSDTEGLVQMIEPQAIMLLQAAAHAQTNPLNRRTPTDADWEEVSDGIVAQGATDAELNAISTSDATSPDLCPGLIKMMRALNAVDSDGVKAVRADYIREVSAG
jgi:hypothetical protein